jgi:hypothetical protein
VFYNKGLECYHLVEKNDTTRNLLFLAISLPMNSGELTKKRNLTQITGGIKNTLDVVSLYSLVKKQIIKSGKSGYKGLPPLQSQDQTMVGLFDNN